MAKTSTPVFAQNAFAKSVSLVTVNACTTRAPVVGLSALAAANIVQLVDYASVNGRRIDKLIIKAAGNSLTAATVAQIVGIWLYDSTTTTAYLIDEIAISAVTPSATSTSFLASKSFDPLLLPTTFGLYVSTTVTTTASTNALTVTALGGDY